MSQTPPFMSFIIEKAKVAGPADEPATLMERIRMYENPVQAPGGWDSGNDIFEALANDIGITHLHLRSAPLSLLEEDRLIRLVRWLIEHLSTWQEESDPKYYELTALFVVAGYCALDKQLWGDIPSYVGQNGSLLGSLSSLIGHFHSSFQAREAMSEPIWERDIVDRFAQADADADWETVDALFGHFRHAIFPNTFLSQLIRCLCRFDFDRLVTASNGIHQFNTAMQSADAIELEDRLRLGIATTSPWMQFACVYGAFSDRRKAEALCSGEIQLLTTLLLNVAQDELRWRKWMAVFNRYPVRYLLLQVALGKALATAPDSAVRAYVNSIQLYPGNQEGRKIVASCLQEFRSSAPMERRIFLWTLAFEKWSQWDFDVANSERYLFEICWSELDYAVVGYAVECLDYAARAATEKGIINELMTVDNHWHASLSDCISRWNRLLSRLQPFAHASATLAAGKDWLAESHYMLVSSETDTYLKMMFSIR